MPLDDFLFEHQYRIRMDELRRQAATQRLAAELARPSAFRRFLLRRRGSGRARQAGAADAVRSGHGPAVAHPR